MEKILEFRIELDEVYEVKGNAGTAAMILFHGFCDCANFRGKVLPGGVDTQVQYKNNNKSLSARYILEGTDASGCCCRIFVENQATLQPNSASIETKPRILTDSATLKWLENADLSGTVEEEQGDILIRIYH
jgi:Protein of unknown function (DUF3237).